MLPDLTLSTLGYRFVLIKEEWLKKHKLILFYIQVKQIINVRENDMCLMKHGHMLSIHYCYPAGSSFIPLHYSSGKRQKVWQLAFVCYTGSKLFYHWKIEMARFFLNTCFRCQTATCRLLYSISSPRQPTSVVLLRGNSPSPTTLLQLTLIFISEFE